METLIQDIRYSLRRLMKSPAFTLVAILTLALGIGANSAIFSVVNGVLLKPLPFEEPDQLVGVYHLTEDGHRAVMSPANFRSVREESRSLEAIAPYYSEDFTLTGAGDPVNLQGLEVGAGFFNDVLKMEPLLGRTFLPEENEPGRNRVAVLSHGLWQQRFGGDADIIGRTIQLNGELYEVVGVMPSGFSYPAERQIWTPIEYDELFLSDNSRGAWYLSVVGRLLPGVSIEQAASEVQTIGQRLAIEYPDTNTDLGFTVFSLHENLVGDLRPALLVLLGAVGFVLLIACANVANLLLARAAARESEFAVRTALGAGRARLIRQLVTESVILGILGGAAGLLLAVWGTGVLVSLQPQDVPRLAEVGVDGSVVLFTAAIAVLTGVLFGLVPALQTTRTDLTNSLKEGGRGALTGKASDRLRSGLIVAEMALAVILLAGAGLLIKSFVQLQNVDPGFRSEGALAFELQLPNAAYEDATSRSAFYGALEDRLAALPGVTSVGGTTSLPLTGTSFIISFEVEGREPAPPGESPSLSIRAATPDYFRTMGIPLLQGRGFTDQDRAGSPPVVLLSSAAVQRHFPNEDPIGKRIEVGMIVDSARVGGVVVGVVGDVKESDLAGEQAEMLYLSHAQVPFGSMNMVVRTAVPPLSLAGAIQSTVSELDPNLPVDNIRTLEQLVSESVSQPRFYMLLLTVFAAVALLLAAIGIFGVMSYAVAQRTREIGIRIALGAEQSSVLKLVVGKALGLAAAGVALGLVGAFALTQLLESLLFGVSATDLPTYLIVTILLMGVASIASYLPALRATRVDPNVALRYE
ncbi:MAG TPA: ABC transporter permease [Longimicrobiaceae bacterium]|nr:ABC transporter permease [Longimicrobiaceae bacterium]